MYQCLFVRMTHLDSKNKSASRTTYQLVRRTNHLQFVPIEPPQLDIFTSHKSPCRRSFHSLSTLIMSLNQLNFLQNLKEVGAPPVFVRFLN
jgi:hypothetical protein